MTEYGKQAQGAWQITLLQVASWFILALSLIGSALTVYYMGLFSFSSGSLILDPIGIILFMLFLAPGLICFPLFQALVRIYRAIEAQRTPAAPPVSSES